MSVVEEAQALQEQYAKAMRAGKEMARDYPEVTRQFVEDLFTNGEVLATTNRQVVRDDWAFSSYERLILTLGQVWIGGQPLPADVEPMEAGNCYENCWIMVSEDPDRWTYVEGYGQASVFPVNHAWLVDNYTGQLVDPTWTDENIGYREHPPLYAGIKFGTEFGRQRVVATNSYSLIAEDWATDASALRYGFEMLDGFAVGGRLADRSNA